MTQLCPACGETFAGHSTGRGGVVTANCPNGHRFRVMIVETVADGSFAYRLTGGVIEDAQ
jgi:hypothetical protein